MTADIKQPALYAFTTKAKEGQTHPGPRVVVDGLEIPVPPHAKVTFTQEPREITLDVDMYRRYEPNPNDAEVRIIIPVADMVRHATYSGPTPADLVAFAAKTQDTVIAFHERIGAMRRRVDLHPDEGTRFALTQYIDGMAEVMTRLGVLVAEHLQ